MSEMCEMCELAPGAYFCQVCETFLCQNDTEIHTKLLNSFQHQIVRLSHEPISHSGSEHFDGDLDKEYLASENFDDIDEGEFTTEVFRLNYAILHDLKNVHDKHVVKTMIFSSRYDINEAFKLFKWVLRPEEAKQLIHYLSFRESIKVVGVYGAIRESLTFVGNVLHLEQTPDFFSDEIQEGIIAFYRGSVSTLCMVFQARDDAVYEQKPYPESSREAIYIRLLLDLCSIVVCCPSQNVLNSWYVSSDPLKANPFLPRIPTSQIIVIQKKVFTGEIETVAVTDNSSEGNFVLTTDHRPYLFNVNFLKNERTHLVEEIEHKLVAWLNCMQENAEKMDKKYYERASSSNFKDFEHAGFLSLVKCIRSYFDVSDDLVSLIKSNFAESMQKVQHHVDQLYKDFVEELEHMFKFKHLLQNTKSDMQRTLTQDQQFARLFHFEDGLLNAMTEFTDIRCNKIKNASKERSFARETLHNFLELKIDYFISRKRQKVFEVFQRLREVLKKSIAEHALRQTVGTVILKTWNIAMTDEGITIENTKQVSKHPVTFSYGSSQLYVFEDNLMFLFIENAVHFKAFAFPPVVHFSDEVENLSTLDSPILLASGSSAALFVAFRNQGSLAYYGSAQNSKGIDKGTILAIYGADVREVSAACILHIRNWVLLLINEAGNVFTMSLLNKEKRLLPVLIEKAAPGKPKNREMLLPEDGSRFYDVQSDSDELHLFFLTETTIEIRDLTYVKIKEIRIAHAHISFKVFSWNMFNVVLIKDGSKLEAYRFSSKRECVESHMRQEKMEVVPGNPIVDILHYALLKFGPAPHFQQQKPAFFLHTPESRKDVIDYVSDISSITNSVRWLGILTPSLFDTFLEEGKTVTVSEFRWLLFTRAPLHLASIQDENLIPLQNGFNNFTEFLDKFGQADHNFVSACVNYVHFGYLEELIRESTDIKVVSVIGKQSSGKSYLLNRIFATRFDVASHRCTDGIWMSLAQVHGQVFLIFDCEGLFSIERKLQEEIKLCLLLAAISDVLILNQDLTFNRNLSSLFEKFVGGLDRLSGRNIFKGCLEIALRDIAPNQNAGAISEMKHFVEGLISNGKIDYLIKMFSGEFQYTAYPNFEKEAEFEKMVVQKREYYVNSLSCHWPLGASLLLFLKTLLAQVYIDDGTAIDSRLIQLKLENISTKLYSAIINPASLKDILCHETSIYTYKASIQSLTISVRFRMFDIELTPESSFQVFEQFFEHIVDRTLKDYEWRDWYNSVDGFVAAYFQLLKSRIVDYFMMAKGRVEPEFQNLIESEKHTLETNFDTILVQRHRLCRRKCSNCYLFCLKPPTHSDNCDCHSPHTCPFQCAQCQRSAPCMLSSGHSDTHICPRCHDPAPEDLICPEECQVYTHCKSKCVLSRFTPHKIHNCGQRYCPFPCAFQNCKKTCCCENHCHGVPTGFRWILSYLSKIQHWCGEKHQCAAECEFDGVCSMATKVEKKVIGMYPNLFEYEDRVQYRIREPCSLTIDEMKTCHSGSHKCNRTHTCSASCPDCGSLCDLPAQHKKLHSSARHQKKSKCVYISVSPSVTFDLIDEKGKKTLTLQPGDSAASEDCIENCGRRGRGHTHPVLCRKLSHCLQQRHPFSAFHSTAKYLPYKGEKAFDLVECWLYWKLKGWKSPVSVEISALFSLCPYWVSQGTQKLYCTKQLFHSQNMNLESHFFPVDFKSNIDICFLIDTTWKEKSCLPEIQQTIERFINSHRSTNQVKTLLIGYAFHYHPPPYLMFSFYPSSCRFSESLPDSALQYLASISDSGQSTYYESALFDAMTAVSNLEWRPNASRLIVIFAGSQPHTPGLDKVAKICMCNSEWRDGIKSLKETNSNVRVVCEEGLMKEVMRVMEVECPGRVMRMPVSEFLIKCVDEDIPTVGKESTTLELAIE